MSETASLADDPLITTAEMQQGLAELQDAVPWTHFFDVAGVQTTSPEKNDKCYRKSLGTKRLGELALSYCKVFTDKGGVEGLRVLDVASAEGGHSILFGRAGAMEVVGVEGRELYLARANFIASAMNVRNVRFILSDVRDIDRARIGQFDVTLCLGMLHRLAESDFVHFLKRMGEVTRDVLILYTHVSTPEAVETFRLQGPKSIGEGLTGYLLQENEGDARADRREGQVRASLDNTFSFWATEETLIRALKISGFGLISKIFEPHVFGGHDNRNLRVIIVAKKMPRP